MYDNQRLIDVLTRHQCYVEGVKAYQHKQFEVVLRKLDAALTSLFATLRVKQMNELSRFALRNFIADLRRTQLDLYAAYSSKVVDDLQAFMAAELLVSKVLFATLQLPEGRDEKPVSEADATGDLLEAIEKKKSDNALLPFLFLTGSAEGNGKLWGRITNTPIPANGIYLLPFIDGFTNSASNAIENTIRKGFSMGSTPAEVLEELRGMPENNFRDGQMNRIHVQAGAMTATAVQHVSAMTQSAVASSYHNHYIWAAILDGRTSAICRSLNGQVFEYGKGPTPPAHINCRSKIVPITEDNAPDVELVGSTWYAFLSRQPKAFREDWLKMERLKNSKEFSGSKPLTVKEFQNKTKLMLIR